MATNYDAPRGRVEDELDADSLESLKAAADTSSSNIDDDGEIVEPFELPALDLSGEELNVDVKPRQENEFTCGSCFLVQKRNRMSHVESDGSEICLDCA